MFEQVGAVGPFEQAAAHLVGDARGDEVLGRAGLVDGGDRGVARIGERAGAVDDLLEHGREVEARADAQAGLAKRGEAGAQRFVLAPERGRPAGPGRPGPRRGGLRSGGHCGAPGRG